MCLARGSVNPMADSFNGIFPQIKFCNARWEASIGQPHRGARHCFPHALEGRILLVAPAAGAVGDMSQGSCALWGSGRAVKLPRTVPAILA